MEAYHFMAEFIFIRHGESTDNLRGVWAGWKDSPLSNHGMRQAEALADKLSDINISAIYSSDLLRAKTTANAVKRKQTNYDDVPIHEFMSLREQHFGAGEGMKFVKKEEGLSLAEHYAIGKFPALHTRHDKFPGGESLDDLAKRAEVIINEILCPHILRTTEDGKTKTIAIVSHGLFIGELVAAIIRRDHERDPSLGVHNFHGMKNTAWTRVEVKVKRSDPSSAVPALSVKINEINHDSHLLNLRRQKGGIGSMTYDPNQLDIRTIFAKKSAASKPGRLKPY